MQFCFLFCNFLVGREFFFSKEISSRQLVNRKRGVRFEMNPLGGAGDSGAQAG